MLYQVTIPIADKLPSNTIFSLGNYISNIVGVFLTVAAVAAFIYLVWGGIAWITAGGDKGKIEEARNRITGAIIGLAIVAVSWSLFLVLDSFFGIGVANGDDSGSNASGNGNGGSYEKAGIGFNCMPESRCNVYCTDKNYYTVRNSGVKCGDKTVGCACVHKTNSKVNPCPTGLSCN